MKTQGKHSRKKMKFKDKICNKTNSSSIFTLLLKLWAHLIMIGELKQGLLKNMKRNLGNILAVKVLYLT